MPDGGTKQGRRAGLVVLASTGASGASCKIPLYCSGSPARCKPSRMVASKRILISGATKRSAM